MNNIVIRESIYKILKKYFLLFLLGTPILIMVFGEPQNKNSKLEKENFQNCLLIGDRGYISKEFQVDLFNYSTISLSVPMRKNQHNFVEFSRMKSKIRKRIETNISQLCGQFTININFAKTFQGLATRIVSKITSFTMIQYLNFFVFKRSLNKLKINLC